MILRHASPSVACRTHGPQRLVVAAAAAAARRTAVAPSSSPRSRRRTHRRRAAPAPLASAAAPNDASSYGWQTDAHAQAQARARSAADPRVRPVRVDAIRRPLAGSRSNDPAKVAALAISISERGLLEPIDVLEVDGAIYGFSGCHRYEAHVRLGRETILCRVRRATRGTLLMHLR